MNEEVIENKPMEKPKLVLTPEQQTGVELILAFMKDDLRPQFKLGGYAGTGKTTMIKALLDELRKDYHTIVSAFTGKACNVLQRKGIHAQTLHSLMYDVKPLPHGKVEFVKKYRLESDPDLIIVDEASMISQDLFDALLSFKKKYLFVGDPGQLEPVGDNPNLMLVPDYTLQTIHRQAQQSPIISLATSVRHGGNITPSTLHLDRGLLITQKILDCAMVTKVDQLICAKNTTRLNINDKIRSFKRYLPNQIVPGEKIIVLRNNLSLGVFNGMILFVDVIHHEDHEKWIVECHDEVNRGFDRLPIWKPPFYNRAEKITYVPKEVIHADYAYAITCHKSQGSEWDSVMVFDEWLPPKVWDMKRWRYTAITRAAKKLHYLI